MQLRQSRNIGNSSKRRASDLARSTSTASRSSTGSSCDAVLRGQGAVEVTTLKELQEETLERNRILESTTEFTPESFEEVRKKVKELGLERICYACRGTNVEVQYPVGGYEVQFCRNMTCRRIGLHKLTEGELRTVNIALGRPYEDCCGL